MFYNYIKIAWRNLIHNKVYSAINILGLAAGMAVALMISLWVYYEYSYDKFLPQYEQVYRVRRNFFNNGEITTFNSNSLKLADALRSNIPEIEYVAETDWIIRHGLMVGDKKFYSSGATAGSDFLKIFQHPLLQGNVDQVLKDPYSIVLTQKMATQLFGTTAPVGKIVRIDNQYDLTVTGILKDIPDNASLQFNYIIPFAFLEQTSPYTKKHRQGNFGINSYQVFLKLKEGASLEKVAAKIKDIQHREDNMRVEVFLQPLKNWRLYGNYVNGVETGGFIAYVKLFSIIGILVLLIACINFVNLTTARSEKRAKEVGIRKAVGSQKKQLVLQFLTESLMVTIMAGVLCLLLVQLFLPAFNSLTGSKILMPFDKIVFWAGMAGCILLTALLAGTRPAFVLSSFNPVKVLKGGGKTGKAATLPRKVLVVAQFTCSVALIISTLVVYKQIQHAKNRPTGYAANRLMSTEINQDLRNSYTALKNELLQRGLVESVTTSSTAATHLNWHATVRKWQGVLPGETAEIGCININQDYFSTMRMQLKEGRNFVGNNGSDSLSVVLNEAAVKRFRFKDPLNQVIQNWDKDYRVVGVVKDALMESPFSSADPTMFMFDEAPGGFMLYRIPEGKEAHASVAALTTLFNKYNTALPYTYEFVNDAYNKKFQQEVLIGKLSGIFAGLAILISCLGLFGLAAYIAQQRTKEIGIRKVLGASISQVWILLSKDFLLLVFISCIIAIPIALFFLQNWLQQYPYRITIGPAAFIIAAVLAMGVTLLTTSFQAIRAALANPVRSLRSE
jgi:predicted permease